MTFKLEFTVDSGLLNDPAAQEWYRREVTHTLKWVAESINEHCDAKHGPIIDGDGNMCGSWEYVA